MANRSEQAYKNFKEAIFQRRLKIGATYSQKEICDILGDSTNPVRDALRILEYEGFLRIKPRSGIDIMQPDLTTFRESHQLRRILEMSAITHFTYSVETGFLEELERSQIEQLERAKQSGDESELRYTQRDIEQALHRSIIKTLRNGEVLRIYDVTIEKINIMNLSRETTQMETILSAGAEHLAILEACKQRDPAAASAALETHLKASLERAIIKY